MAATNGEEPTGGIALFEDGRGREALPLLRKEARKEEPPGLATLYLGAAESDRHGDASYVEEAARCVGDNVPEDLVLQVVGATKYDLGSREDGLDLMRKAVQLNPSRKNILVFATRLDDSRENDYEAIRLYERLLENNDEDVNALLGWAAIAGEQGQATEAQEALRKLLRLLPEDPKAHYELGNILEREDEPAFALLLFQRAVELGHWRPQVVWVGIADCYLKLGKPTKAARAVKKALKIEPEFDYALEIKEKTETEIEDKRRSRSKSVNRSPQMSGSWLFDQGRWQEASVVLKKEACKEEPAVLARLYLAALKAMRTGNPRHLDRAVRESVGEAPTDLLLQVKGVIAHDAAREREEGLNMLREAVQLKPSRKNIVTLASRLGQIPEYREEALRLYELLLDRDGEDVSGLIGWACMVERGRPKEAEQALRRALRISPNDPFVYYKLGDVFGHNDEQAIALLAFQRAVALGFEDLHCAWAGVANCYLNMGKSKEAAQAARKALKISPDYEYAREIRKLCGKKRS